MALRIENDDAVLSSSRCPCRGVPKQELGETEDVRSKGLLVLKELISDAKAKGATFVSREDDAYLLRFLRSKKVFAILSPSPLLRLPSLLFRAGFRPPSPLIVAIISTWWWYPLPPFVVPLRRRL